MDHFQVLPTDKRYQELTEYQIDVLFVHNLLRADDYAIRKTYWEEKEKSIKKNSFPEEFFRKQGYSEEQISRFKEEYAVHG